MSTSTIELVAVACVVESSLVLASEWSRVLVDYISPLLKRLGEAHTVGHQMMVCRYSLLFILFELTSKTVPDSFCDICHSRHQTNTTSSKAFLCPGPIYYERVAGGAW